MGVTVMGRETFSQYTLGQFRHEKDSGLISDIMNHELARRMCDWMEKEHVEDAYRAVYEASCICLTREGAFDIPGKVERACDVFGVAEIPQVYLYRNYEKTIRICGLNKPFLLLSSDFLEAVLAEEPEMLYGIVAGQVAGIRAGHNIGMMLSWLLETMVRYLPVPDIVLNGLDALLNEWNRCRFYTYDRAFYLATGNYQLALRSLFVPVLSTEMLDKFSPGKPDDGYRTQAERFRQDSAPERVIKMINSMRSDAAWIPERYKELEVLQSHGTGKGGRYVSRLPT